MNARSSANANRLTALQGYLEQDPHNLQLMADTAAVAYEAGETGIAAAMLTRYADQSPLPASLQNLKGIIALGNQDYGQAVDIFEPLLTAEPNNSALQFNLAWAKAMVGEHQAALSLLGGPDATPTAQVATLKVQMLHSLGRLDEALALGGQWAQTYPQDEALAGALACAAVDAGDTDLAKRYAKRAGQNHNGLSAAGLMLLREGQIDPASELFSQALEAYPFDARALLGRGLVLMTQGASQDAVACLRRGAELFSSHIGSWVALGWAYLAAGQHEQARTTFEKALMIDDTFAETHGSLAVLDVIGGQLSSARRRTEIALRLDRRCFSAALAKSLLLQADGDSQKAAQIRSIAMTSVLGSSGATLAQALAQMGFGRRLQ